ncbi:MAG: acetyl-CoA C-acetyltransferase [Actinomycetota bacterium]|nr:acetyl-CoA C-acetyltransferase [Actinomycetota bacterium]
MTAEKEVFIIAGARTPVGRFGGSLKDISARELGIIITKEIIKRAKINYDQIDEVIFGNARQAGNGPNLARQIAFFSGIPEYVPSYTINKACGSSLKAISLAAQSIKAGDCDVVLVGGTESMSNIPYLLMDARWGYRLGDNVLVDSQYKDGIFCPLADCLMGKTAEGLVDKFSFTREQLDKYALRSQNLAEKAIKSGQFKDEIIPVEVKKKKEKIIFDTDEHPRFGMTMEKLAKLPPLYKKDGKVTAGNTCGINDAAAGIIVASSEKIKELNLKPIARIVSYASSAYDPKLMGLGPVGAIKKSLKEANLTVDDLGLIEINEAFSSQILGDINMLGWDWEKNNIEDKLNIYGNGIALGHPVGATGARIFVTLMYGLIKSHKKYGLSALCISGGQGDAIVIENLT